MAAYDGYRSQPDPHQQTYPSKSNYDYDYTYEARPRQPSSTSSSRHQDAPSQHQPPGPRPRSRSSSNARSEGIPHIPPQQPLNNAIGNAFDKSDTARAVDPDLIAQITAEVKKSVLDEIKMNGMGVGAGVGAPQTQPATTAAPPPPHHVPQSPASTTSASIPSRNVYTPPSPEHHDFSSHGSVSSDSMARDSMFDGNDDTPTPRYERNKPTDAPSDNIPKARPAPTTRMSQEDCTPIERMWQRLFDHQNQPTPRLGQFLRGLALHLIDDYEPKKSLVITPSKMLKFYEDVKLHDEIYPWQVIFGQLPYSTLSKIYREMRCQHHLVQEHPADQPLIPALTPEGFQEWMTAMIQAYPDTEYQRLSKAVLDMPISNADDNKERFPKELPRRLFPHTDHLQAQQRCAAAISVGGIGPLRRAPTFPPPPPMGQSNTSTANLERERSPYATCHTDNKVFESEDEHEGPPPSMPLERERKPYSAAPGKGKVYNDDANRSMHSDASMNEHKRRAQSATAQSQWVPPPNATATHQYSQHRTGSMATDRRPRSPSFSSYGTRSDPSVRDVPGNFYASNIYDSEEESRRLSKEAEMKRTEHHRRSTAGTDSSYESQPRSVYDDDYYRGRGGTNGYDSRGFEARRY